MNQIKTLLLLVVFLFSVGTGMAQLPLDKKEQRKIERAEKKRLKEEERQEKHDLLISLVQDQNFVLEATAISGRNMNRFDVSPNTNFVMVEGNQVTIQTASNFNIGYNGLGGITIKGTIRDYEVLPSKNNKGASVIIQFSSPLIGLSTLNLNIQANGFASVMFYDNWGGRSTFHGQVHGLEDLRIFEGRPII